ncbi:hypothetical protein GCM10025791_11380 [Halioxenophilus aromaticivorans]|uniref:Fic/DOC N-terminal domain-containing protein n=1 Tax=Halioxenophilus aromaticivorans TaxID=1306992 RepID=A0AAV3TZ91_9ALTE
MKVCFSARAALTELKQAELKQAGELLPNQGLLINLLPLLEARASTEIENTSPPPTNCSSTQKRAAVPTQPPKKRCVAPITGAWIETI